VATITPILWTAKRDGEGRSPIYIRIQVNRQRALVSLGEKALDNEWDENRGRLKGSSDRVSIVNTIISDRVAALEREAARRKLERQPITARGLKESVSNERGAKADFFTHADLYIRHLEQQGKVYTARRYRNVTKHLRTFCGGPLSLDDITSAFLRSYKSHRIAKRGNKETTVVSHLKAIRAIFNRARNDGAVRPGHNPFADFRVGDPSGKIVRLTLDDIERIKTVVLRQDSGVSRARDYLLFSIYCAGIRFKDLCLMRWDHVVSAGDGRLRLDYTMSKTQRNKSILLAGPAQAILEKYGDPKSSSGFIFPLLVGYDLSDENRLMSAIQSRNALINKDLRRLKETAGIRISFSYYASRHSYADIARRAGESIYDISHALGHSSIKQTENYLDRFDSPALDGHIDRLWGG